MGIVTMRSGKGSNTLTAASPLPLSSSVKWLQKCVVFALLALWLPATQHCNLEAAGVIAHENADSDGCCETATPCAHDSCDVAEGSLVRPSVTIAKIFTPDLAFCFCLLCSRLSLTSPPDTPVLAVTDTERPIDWLPAWQFSRRTALPARAPSIAA
jgi:hypothetical protein